VKPDDLWQSSRIQRPRGNLQGTLQSSPQVPRRQRPSDRFPSTGVTQGTLSGFQVEDNYQQQRPQKSASVGRGTAPSRRKTPQVSTQQHDDVQKTTASDFQQAPRRAPFRDSSQARFQARKTNQESLSLDNTIQQQAVLSTTEAAPSIDIRKQQQIEFSRRGSARTRPTVVSETTTVRGLPRRGSYQKTTAPARAEIITSSGGEVFQSKQPENEVLKSTRSRQPPNRFRTESRGLQSTTVVPPSLAPSSLLPPANIVSKFPKQRQTGESFINTQRFRPESIESSSRERTRPVSREETVTPEEEALTTVRDMSLEQTPTRRNPTASSRGVAKATTPSLPSTPSSHKAVFRGTKREKLDVPLKSKDIEEDISEEDNYPKEFIEKIKNSAEKGAGTPIKVPSAPRAGRSRNLIGKPRLRNFDSDVSESVNDEVIDQRIPNYVKPKEFNSHRGRNFGKTFSSKPVSSPTTLFSRESASFSKESAESPVSKRNGYRTRLAPTLSNDSSKSVETEEFSQSVESEEILPTSSAKPRDYNNSYRTKKLSPITTTTTTTVPPPTPIDTTKTTQTSNKEFLKQRYQDRLKQTKEGRQQKLANMRPKLLKDGSKRDLGLTTETSQQESSPTQSTPKTTNSPFKPTSRFSRPQRTKFEPKNKSDKFRPQFSLTPRLQDASIEPATPTVAEYTRSRNRYSRLRKEELSVEAPEAKTTWVRSIDSTRNIDSAYNFVRLRTKDLTPLASEDMVETVVSNEVEPETTTTRSQGSEEITTVKESVFVVTAVTMEAQAETSATTMMISDTETISDGSQTRAQTEVATKESTVVTEVPTNPPTTSVPDSGPSVTTSQQVCKLFVL